MERGQISFSHIHNLSSMFPGGLWSPKGWSECRWTVTNTDPGEENCDGICFFFSYACHANNMERGSPESTFQERFKSRTADRVRLLRLRENLWSVWALYSDWRSSQISTPLGKDSYNNCFWQPQTHTSRHISPLTWGERSSQELPSVSILWRARPHEIVLPLLLLSRPRNSGECPHSSSQCW